MIAHPDASAGTVPLVGVPVHALSFDDALTAILGWAGTRSSRTAHFCNAHLAVIAHDDGAVRRALAGATLVTTDGLPLVWLARLLGRRAQRVAGPDVMAAVMDRGRTVGATHFLYGATPQVLDALRGRLTARFPQLRIVGAIAPSFGPASGAELDEHLARINAADPDYVWVGLGAPKQDLWIEDVRDRLRVGGLLAVGAAFDFHAGSRRRAPRWMQRTGTEWVFRLLNEPRRLWRRYAVTNSRFVLLAARQLASRRGTPTA